MMGAEFFWQNRRSKSADNSKTNVSFCRAAGATCVSILLFNLAGHYENCGAACRFFQKLVFFKPKKKR